MGVSKGGLSLDDINLSETQCPHHTWHIQNFTSLLTTVPVGSKIYSPTFLSPDGYSFQIGLYVNGKSNSPISMAMYLHLTSGPNDSQLNWPCPWRQATIALMDQHPNIQQRMDNQRMITTNPMRTSTDCKNKRNYIALKTEIDKKSMYLHHQRRNTIFKWLTFLDGIFPFVFRIIRTFSPRAYMLI